jgi:hypothetical protein
MSDANRTAEEWQSILTNHIKDRKRFLDQQARVEFYEDLRDDVLSLIKNSGLSDEEIHARCGPHPHTLASWRAGNVRRPQMGKMRSTLRILGHDFGIV